MIGDWIEEDNPEPVAQFIRAWREASKPMEKPVDERMDGAVE